MRHREWVCDALEYLLQEFGSGGQYTDMYATCVDRFLVYAFIEATYHFVYGQLGIDCNEGRLSQSRRKEIKRLIKITAYDGSF
jgi:hypothetical protein